MIASEAVVVQDVVDETDSSNRMVVEDVAVLARSVVVVVVVVVVEVVVVAVVVVVEVDGQSGSELLSISDSITTVPEILRSLMLNVELCKSPGAQPSSTGICPHRWSSSVKPWEDMIIAPGHDINCAAFCSVCCDGCGLTSTLVPSMNTTMEPSVPNSALTFVTPLRRCCPKHPLPPQL